MSYGGGSNGGHAGDVRLHGGGAGAMGPDGTAVRSRPGPSHAHGRPGEPPAGSTVAAMAAAVLDDDPMGLGLGRGGGGGMQNGAPFGPGGAPGAPFGGAGYFGGPGHPGGGMPFGQGMHSGGTPWGSGADDGMHRTSSGMGGDGSTHLPAGLPFPGQHGGAGPWGYGGGGWAPTGTGAMDASSSVDPWAIPAPAPAMHASHAGGSSFHSGVHSGDVKSLTADMNDLRISEDSAGGGHGRYFSTGGSSGRMVGHAPYRSGDSDAMDSGNHTPIVAPDTSTPHYEFRPESGGMPTMHEEGGTHQAPPNSWRDRPAVDTRPRWGPGMATQLAPASTVVSGADGRSRGRGRFVVGRGGMASRGGRGGFRGGGGGGGGGDYRDREMQASNSDGGMGGSSSPTSSSAANGRMRPPPGLGAPPQARDGQMSAGHEGSSHDESDIKSSSTSTPYVDDGGSPSAGVAVHTPAGRRALGEMLKNAGASGESELAPVRRELLAGLLPSIRSVARGRVSNFFFQDLYECCSVPQRIDVLRCLFFVPEESVASMDPSELSTIPSPPHGTPLCDGDDSDPSMCGGDDSESRELDLAFVRDLATDKHGTRAMQLMVSVASSPGEHRILLATVMPLVGILGTSRGGCHVLMGFLRSAGTHWPDTHRTRVADAIVRHADDISTNRFGSRVVQHLLEGSAGTLPVVANVAAHVARRAPSWVRHDSANFLVSTLFWNANRFVDQAEEAARLAIRGRVIDLVRDRCGSHVVQAALGSQLLPATRLAIMAELCDSEHASIVVVNRFANYVAQAAIRAASGNEAARNMVSNLYLAAFSSPLTAGPGPRCVKDQFERAFPAYARELIATHAPTGGS